MNLSERNRFAPCVTVVWSGACVDKREDISAC